MAIKQYNYDGTNTAVTPSGGGRLKPFVYAETPQVEQKKEEEKKPFSLGKFLKDVAVEAVKLPIRAALNVRETYESARLLGDIFNEKAFNERKAKIDERVSKGIDSPTFGNLRPIGNTGKGFGADLKDTIGAGLEASSYIPIAKIPSLVSKSLGQSALRTAGQFAKEGLIAGGLGGAGYEMQNPDSTLGSIAKSTAIGSVAGGALGGVLGGATGAVSKTLSKRVRPFDYSTVTETPVTPKAVPEAPQLAAEARKYIGAEEVARKTPGQARIADLPNFERASNLSPTNREIEDKAFQYVLDNEDKILAAYRAEHGKVINADNFRPLLRDAGYTDGSLAAAVQEPVSYLAKRARTIELQNPGNYVVGTAGGSGVGKTSAADVINEIRSLQDDAAMVLDSNFSSLDSAHKFIKEVQEAGKEFVGVYTYREAMDSLVNGIVKRMLTNKTEMGRLVPNHVSAGNHIDSWNVVQKLVDEGYNFRFVDNSLGAGKAKLVTLDELKDKIKYPSKTELNDAFNKEVKRLYENKVSFTDKTGTYTVSKKQYEGLIDNPTSAPKPVTAEADALPSRVFKRLQAEDPSIEGDLNYNPIKLKEDAEKAVNLIAKDRQKAFDIAMGKEASSDVTSTAVNIAMAEKALNEGNTALYSRLIKNRSLEQTRRGQEIVAEKASVTDNSTSRYVKELIGLRLEKLGNKYLSDLKDVTKRTSTKQKGTNQIEKEVQKVQRQIKDKKLTMQDARQLLDALACV